jgi:hypothetical protein
MTTHLGPSPHLSWSELACKDAARTPYPREWRETRAVELAAVFEVIRARAGNQPILVLSAFRTPEHNRRVGGVDRNSQHLYGRALDLRPPAGWTPQTFFALIRGLAEELYEYEHLTGEKTDLIGGLGLYSTFVHVDTRQGTRLAVWRG